MRSVLRQEAAQRLAQGAARPFDNPRLRKLLATAQRRDEQVIDTVSIDTVLSAGRDEQARGTGTPGRRQFPGVH